MKIIDLLNKIANGEEVPKKIKYRDWLYEFEKDCNDYLCQYDSLLYRENDDVRQFLNDNVEILEEEPYIEICGRWFTKSEYNEFVKDEEEKKIPEPEKDILHIDDLITPVDENMYKIWKQAIKNHNKINEIIDYLKSKGE